jgi:NADH-quinone oxidoreductase subunit N
MAAFPMHFWCPDVYEGAPTPFTAYLSVASKAAGFAVFVRFAMAFRSDYGITVASATEGIPSYTVSFGWVGIIGGAAALSMTAGNLAALWQKNLKRMLAYSSIAHAGFLLMGVAALRPESAQSALEFAPLFFYLIIYFFMNLAAFYIITLVSAKTGGESLESYKGLGLRAPLLAVMLTLCLVSLLGIPPTGGFTGKLQIFKMAIKGDLIWLAIIAGLNTAVSAFYYFRVIQAIWLDEGTEKSSMRVAWGHLALVVVLSIPVLVLGLAFQPVAAFVRQFGF